jgi:hypothetical protein
VNLISVDLSKKEKSFAHWLTKILSTLDKKSIDEMKEMISKSRDEGVNVSEQYINNVISTIDSFNGNKNKVLRYLGNIMLKGADLGVISSVELMAKIAKLYGSMGEFIVDFTIRESALLKTCDLLSNLKETWEKANSDIDMFSKRVMPFIKNYLTRRNSIADINEMRKAVTQATEGAARLVNRNDVWSIVETIPSKVLASKDEILIHRTSISFNESGHKGEPTEIDNSKEIDKHKQGDMFTVWMGAPGTGSITYKITKKNKQGLWGIKIKDTSRILEDYDVI